MTDNTDFTGILNMSALGDKLKEAREKKSLTIGQANKQTHIHPTVLKALEDGKFLSEATQKERMTMKEGVIEGWPVSYGLGIYNDNGAVGHYGNYVNYYTAYCMRYKGYDFAVLENGELKEHHEEGRHPARSIFWNAVRDIGLLTE